MCCLLCVLNVCVVGRTAAPKKCTKVVGHQTQQKKNQKKKQEEEEKKYDDITATGVKEVDNKRKRTVTDEEKEEALKAVKRGTDFAEEAYTAQVLKFNEQHRNTNTAAVYASRVKQFEMWCAKQGVIATHLYYKPSIICSYLIYLSTTKCSTSTVQSTMAAIKDKLKYNIEEWNLISSSVLLKETRKTVVKITKPVKSKKPLTKQMILQMLMLADERKLNTGLTFIVQRNIFLIVLMMSAFLRESEAVALGPNDVSIREQNVDGVVMEILHVHVRKAKNDQEQKGHDRDVCGGEINDNTPSENEDDQLTINICELYRRYKSVCVMTSPYLFHQQNGKKLSKTTPAGILKHAVESIGIDPDEYSSHSARAGGVTEAHKAGAAITLIKRHGNWKSDSVYLYIRPSTNEMLHVTSFLTTNSSTQQQQ